MSRIKYKDLIELSKSIEKPNGYGKGLHHVYFHYNDNKEVFYIGEGFMKRHIAGASRPKAWHEEVTKNKGYKFEILAWGFTKSAAHEFERKLINLVGKENLTNNTTPRRGDLLMIDPFDNFKITRYKTMDKPAELLGGNKSGNVGTIGRVCREELFHFKKKIFIYDENYNEQKLKETIRRAKIYWNL